jgi:adenylate kinase
MQAHPFVASGKLVPDELVNAIIAERFERADRPEQFVLDGYPRTLAQAKALDELLGQHKNGLTAVVLLKVSDEAIVRRLSGRWSCPQSGCMATYHTQRNPPKTPGMCDRCGSKLVQREDDKEETVRARLVVYHKNIGEIIPHYRRLGLLSEVCGEAEIEVIYQAILAAL